MTSERNETTLADDQQVVTGDGGLVAPAPTRPLGEEETLAPFVFPAPDAETRVDGLDNPIEAPTWTVAEVATLTGRFIAVFWAMTVFWFLFVSVIPMVIGWSPTVITTGSMAPAVSAGSVVHVDGGVDLQQLGPGSIITYDDANVEGRLITHRVVEVMREVEGGPTTGFRTKGDANADSDSGVVALDAVHGATRLVVPYVGLPRVWMNEGQWWVVTLFALATAIAAVIALDTFGGYLTGRTMFRRRSVTSAIAIAIAVMLGGPASNAAFAATTDNVGNQFDMTSNWFIEAIDADSPIAHWRLDDGAGGPATVLTQDFEGAVTLNQYNAGQIALSTLQARSGTTSLRKTSNNDPNGGWIDLPGGTITDNFVFDAWIYRPTGWGGGPIDRLGLEDAAFNGYTFHANHTNNRLRIDRRTGGSPQTIGTTVAFNPPEDEWYRLNFVRDGADMTLSAFDAGGTLLASTTATDATYNSFDRLVIRGGHQYFIDDVTITTEPPVSVAVDRIGTEDGVYEGTEAYGQPSLLASLPGVTGSVDFDGVGSIDIADDPALTSSARNERTVELWFAADTVAGRQLIYDEGGWPAGVNLYLDGGQLYARAWDSTWSNEVQAATGAGAVVVGQRYHVALVLDAVTDRSLELYVNGSLVATGTKTDTNALGARSDGISVAEVDWVTRYHDGWGFDGWSTDDFDGRIDEIVVFDTALAVDRVEAHWFAGR